VIGTQKVTARQEEALSSQGSPAEFDEMESAVRTYCRLFDRIFSRASGTCVYDQDGNRYLDFWSGAGALSYGHNNPHIKAAVVKYLEADGILHSLDLHTTAKLAFLRKFRDVILAPRGVDYRVQFCGPTGADTVEAALKLARKVTGQSTVLAFTNAYHGVSLGALAATASARHRASAGLPLQSVVRMPFDGYLGAGVDTLALLQSMLAPGSGIERPAAIIVETVQAEGGINVASVEWLQRLAELARRQGILLIVDDIQAGCGRTGTFFSFERAGIQPDLVCLSKAIGGIGMPMGLTLVKPEHDLWKPGDHVGTFRGNNLAFVAAAAALDYWQTPELAMELERLGRKLSRCLTQIADQYPDHCDGVRGLGLIQGLAWRDPAVATSILRAAFARGLIIESCGPRQEVVKLLPPLTISDHEMEEGLTILSEAVRQAVDSSSNR
jgi:diaminobutyrate-2-oxoglutarate transaminase